uniref:EGF-like domain-containing protein n=1 Tax=Magallana gigas TaxID=29159 RepID=A0A8W8M4U5_MAGGI|nr:protein draper-like [Crassostrea gigas]
MNNTDILVFLIVIYLWNFGYIYSTLCGSVNGTSCCSGFYWDKTQMSCIPCKVGYFGTNCDKKCVYPLYGKDCQLTCNCSKRDCWHVGGCTLNITDNICGGQTGAIICCNGFKWNNEDRKCIRCDNGYTGQNCEDVCRFPSYGRDCQSICNCTQTKCNPVDGCYGHSTRFEMQMSDIFTKAVDRELYQQVLTEKKQSTLMIGIGVLAAVALFIVIAIFVTYRLENTNKENESNIYYSIK